MHVYRVDDYDYIIAESFADAEALSLELFGEGDDPPWEREIDELSDESQMCLCVNKDGKVADEEEVFRNEHTKLTLTCGEWAKRNGRGMFASSEN